MISVLCALAVSQAAKQKPQVPPAKKPTAPAEETYQNPGPPKVLPRTSIRASAWAMGVAVDLVGQTPKDVFDRLGVPDKSLAGNDGVVWFQEYASPVDPEAERPEKGVIEVRYSRDKRVESVRYLPAADRVNVQYVGKYFAWPTSDILSNTVATTLETFYRDPKAERPVPDQNYYIHLPIKSRKDGKSYPAFIHAKIATMVEEKRDFDPAEGAWRGRYVYMPGTNLESILRQGRVVEFTVPGPTRHDEKLLTDLVLGKLATPSWVVRD